LSVHRGLWGLGGAVGGGDSRGVWVVDARDVGPRGLRAVGAMLGEARRDSGGSVIVDGGIAALGWLLACTEVFESVWN
jgi:hypothetical protein